MFNSYIELNIEDTHCNSYIDHLFSWTSEMIIESIKSKYKEYKGLFTTNNKCILYKTL